MAEPRKFYRHRYTLEVLSETQFDGDVELRDVLRECDEGELVLHSISHETFEETPQIMAKLLNDCGSEPGFFNLDDEGKDLDQEDEPDGDIGPHAPEPGRGSPDA